MKIFCICLFLHPLCSLLAQDTTIFAPIGAVWHYNSYENFDDSPIYFKFAVEKDTLIIGQNARLLRYYVFENDSFHTSSDLNKYIFSYGNKVFYKVENEFVILFDFGASIGDTIHSLAEDYPVSMGCNPDFTNGPIDYSYRIDSTSNLNVDGINLRLQYVHVIEPPGASTPWFFNNPIIERIGAHDYGGFWWGQGGGCIFENNGFLRCYEDPDIFYKNPDVQYECDYTPIREIYNTNSSGVHPNPADDFISLSDNAQTINIYNSTGQKILGYKNQNQIDISDFPPDLYLIQYRIGKLWYSEKFIKL